MYAGGSLFLIAIGAILYWAISFHVNGVDLHMIGMMLMVIGVLSMGLGSAVLKKMVSFRG